MEMAAVAKSASPAISEAITYDTVALGDAKRIRAGRYSMLPRSNKRKNAKPSPGKSINLRTEMRVVTRNCCRIWAKDIEVPISRRARGKAIPLKIFRLRSRITGRFNPVSEIVIPAMAEIIIGLSNTLRMIESVEIV
jgi:hypothetical protein